MTLKWKTWANMVKSLEVTLSIIIMNPLNHLQMAMNLIQVYFIFEIWFLNFFVRRKAE